MKEGDFQASLIKELRDTFPGSIVLKNDPGYLQGVPDLLVLHKDKWATLECKACEKSPHQPNQDYYVATMNNMSYSAFVCPENKGDILNDLKQHFRV